MESDECQTGNVPYVVGSRKSKMAAQNLYTAELLINDGTVFLSNRLYHDPLEKFMSCCGKGVEYMTTQVLQSCC